MDERILFVEQRKVCLAYSAGGHFTELNKALAGIQFTRAYHVSFKTDRFNEDSGVLRYFITHPRKRVLRTLVNAWQALMILLKERPEIIISTGADVTVPTIVLGKLLFRCKVVFIESGGDISPTLTGRMVHRFCDLFIVQWPEQKQFYSKAVLSKGILL